MLKCDKCGNKADSIHFLSPPYSYPQPEITGEVQVKFACPSHDFEGYWVPLNRWNDPKENFPQHVFDKSLGPAARKAWLDRMDALEEAGR